MVMPDATSMGMKYQFVLSGGVGGGDPVYIELQTTVRLSYCTQGHPFPTSKLYFIPIDGSMPDATIYGNEVLKQFVLTQTGGGRRG